MRLEEALGKIRERMTVAYLPEMEASAGVFILPVALRSEVLGVICMFVMEPNVAIKVQIVDFIPQHWFWDERWKTLQISQADLVELEQSFFRGLGFRGQQNSEPEAVAEEPEPPTLKVVSEPDPMEPVNRSVEIFKALGVT